MKKIINEAALCRAELPESLGIETNELKSVLNATGVEYGDYSVTFALGCYHQCEYCYDATCKVRFKKVADFEAWGKPLATNDFLTKLDLEIVKKKHKIKSVMLSFAGDPFPYNPEGSPDKKYFHDLSLAALEKLNAAGLKCCVLTKGLLPLELANYAPADPTKNNWYGISLVNLSHEDEYRKKIEPNAAPLTDRLASLKALKEKDSRCKTFISLEPFPVPSMIDGMDEASMKKELEYVLSQLTWVDLVIFGRGNGNNAKGVNMFAKYKDHKGYYLRMAEVVKAWGEANDVDIYVKRKVYGIGKKDKNGNKLPKVELF